ncbi:MAG: hypothetical protein MJE66_14435 [Proteobacteria bacterium]|nr:hypothetical protein [Pseudomonadota bacterium]
MGRVLAYRILAGSLGAFCLLGGAFLFAAFFRYQTPHSEPPLPTGPWGHYLGAMAGCALIAWGGGLVGVARRPETGRALATASALALTGMALYRMLAWVIGDYYAVAGDLLRVEAGLFLVLALGFVWLRPAADAGQEGIP